MKYMARHSFENKYNFKHSFGESDIRKYWSENPCFTNLCKHFGKQNDA